MHKKYRIQPWALASIAALAIAGCGGGNDTAEDAGPMMVNAFAYVQPIAASTLDTAEPQDISLLVLSTTETDEPDTKL